MADLIVKFRFLKTPQLRHRFRCFRGNPIFPNVKYEIFNGTLVGDFYEFHGKSASGRVPRENFDEAVMEGYVLKVQEPNPE